MKRYNVVIYYRTDGQLTEAHITVEAASLKDAKQVAKRHAAEYQWTASTGEVYSGRVVTVEVAK